MGPEWIAPIIGGIIAVVTASVAGFISIKNTRAGAQEHRAPTANQAWDEADRARERMHAFEDLFYAARGALRNLVRALRSTNPDYVFTQDVLEAINLEPPKETESTKEKS